uniref:glycosyltransferase family 2 protein n=1 Tax=Trichocoleus desertorum TaxID=1481672 RepID=UPI0025B2AE6F|nr:glycosyltransferase family 2 protein [Trichocoleus desertorum]
MSDSINYPSISVVIPSFNQGQYIEETLLSVIGQGYPNLEVLVLDGGSTDNTVGILEKYSDKISYWHSKKDKGQADAINQGMNLSSGEIVCWINSDDMYLPGTLLDIGRRFQGLTDENYLIYGSALAINQVNENLFSGAHLASSFDAFKLTYDDFIVQPSSFWTRKLWQATGDLNTNYHYVLDWDWFIRASEFTKFEYVNKFFSIYRFHELHKTSTGGLKRRQEILEVVTKYSSDYWKSLYTKVNTHYASINKTKKNLDFLRIPKQKLFLCLFFPELIYFLKNQNDLGVVLGMYMI